MRLAQALAPYLQGGDLVILDGQLGSGKTFFTRALCRALGLPAFMRVTSPTFGLVHEYELQPRLAHVDVYRLESPPEVEELGLRSLRSAGWAVVAEWARPYLDVLGGDALIIELRVDPRCARMTASGPRASELLDAVSKQLER